MRVVRAALLVSTILALAVEPAAEAASPASGTLQRTKRVLRWSGGPFAVAETNYLGPACVAGADDPLCDHFQLTIRLGEDAVIRVTIKTPSANPEDGVAPLDGDDYDLYVYAPNGSKVAQAENSAGNETLVFTHRARNNGRPYEVRVAPWSVRPGSTYKGTVTALTLGR